MKFKEAKDVFFNSEKIRPVLAGMTLLTQEEFFKCFFHCPTKFGFKRVDGSEINLTVRVYLDLQDSDKDGKDNLVFMFFRWKERFDGFEKKVLDVIADESCHGPVYPFLRSALFLKNSESWEKEGVDKWKYEIKESYETYRRRRDRDVGCLQEYYIVEDNNQSKILANVCTHQLYHLIKTMEGTNGEGFSWVPLMVKYEDVYKRTIEEHECTIWNGKF